MSNESKSGKSLLSLMTYSTAIAFGGMGAFLGSLRDIRHDATLVFSSRTIIGFVLGFVLGWLFWQGVKYLIRKDPGEPR